jgi:hypothetical protein
VSVPRLAVVLLALLVAPATAPTPARAAAPPVATCTIPGSSTPRDCGSWFTTDVTISWTWEPGATDTNCNVVTIKTDTPGSVVTCRVWYGSDYVEAGKVIKRDATPPTVSSGATARAPDSGEWFNKPVGVAFSATDATSGPAGCTGGTYSGPDSASATVTGTCRDVAGNASTGSLTLRYDATPPTVTASASRSPDGNGWYREPLTVAFTAADGLSGVASCDGPAVYRGPDTAAAELAGTCRDHAGNAGPPAAVTIRYDSTPPPAARGVEVDAGDGVARLSWARAPSAQLYELVRTPGLGKARKSTVYRGARRGFVDRRVRNGVRYRYELLSVDRAGNRSGRVVAALPRPAVFSPAEGTVVRGQARAEWEDIPKARFYNAQLYRGTEKILSAWVRAPRLLLPRRWTYDGVARTLADGRYRLFVWPAFGTRAKPRYGRLLGDTSFVIRRGS